MMHRVMIVEDEPMARQLLEIFVKNSGRYTVVQSIENAAMAEVYCISNQIDIILMDVCTAMNSSGLEAAEKIKKHYPHIKIVIITSQPECSFIERARSIGVDSFWYKNSSAKEIVSVMNDTMEGKNIYPSSTPELVIGDALSSDFSERELEVLRYVVAGDTDAAIAEKMFIAVGTVKFHIQSMKNKTGFRNRTELAVKVRESGLIINDQKREEYI